ncbi:MAG: PorT family protein [Bacteroidota bacterium]|nr:PorT family protein [Bacteroidota bacterium]
MLRVLWYKIIFIFLIHLFSIAVFSQEKNRSYNYFKFNKKSHYFGLTLGYNQSSFKVEHSKNLIQSPVYRINEGISVPGLTLSMITNFKIGDYFDFRILPSISLSYRRLLYQPLTAGAPAKEDLFEFVFGELPMLIRFTSSPYKDKRVFFLTGVKYSYDFASNSRANKEKFKIVRLSPHDFQFEIGAGMQFFLPFFIFSPEIKFSHGLSNLLFYDAKLSESTIIDKLFSKCLTISLHFEG